MLVPIRKLRYDCFDWDDRKFIKAFYRLERTLPVIPEDLVWFVGNYYCDLMKVFYELQDKGLKDALILVSLPDGTYRVILGNQRLLCIRAQRKLTHVLCQEFSEYVKR